MFGKRILILAAHPDDEVVACAAAIGRAQAKGAELFVLFLTHGCIAKETIWPWDRKKYDKQVARRRAESEAAAKLFNITPLGWSPRPARHLWRDLSAVYKEALTVADQNKIDQIWVPAYEGGNADHDALNAAGSLLRVRFNVLEFAEYNYSGRKARSQQFPHPNASEQTITLTPAETEKKEAALALYKSEQGNLSYVQTKRECWRALAAYDYNQPPHAGKLWYARFQWVPFRHPRVDFTDPAEVSAAIAEFLKNPSPP